LAGRPATQQCKTLGTNDGGMLPSDNDGAMSPPAGAPNDIVEFGTNSLKLYRFHVDWANTANTTLTGPTTISVAAFTPACTHGRNAGPIPAGNVCTRLELSLDGERRNGRQRRYRPRLQRLELHDAPGHPVHGTRDIRSARRDGAGRSIDLRGHRLADAVPRHSAAEPVGRLLEHQRRPVRRLHVLVHERVPRLERRLQLAHADRHVQARRLWHSSDT